ncbi:MAG: hypothetical protein IT204_23785 [Fimbriimonadaceae bacterium]|nr:hypothetical protein [Fimbriimonadaceae bacterium]
MSADIELTVALKIPDVTAVTARRTLQGRLGYGEQLADLRRADWWRLTVAPAGDAALALGQELAERTNVFVNPTKHVYRCAQRAAAPAAPAGCTAVGVLTGFLDEATADLTLQALRGRLGYGDRVLAVQRGTLWTFHLRTTDLAAARDLAAAMTVSRDRATGLLVNPHSQWWRWLDES